MSIKSKVETITPSKAASYIKNMVNNRKLSSQNVKYFVHIIESGQWAVTGQPVIFSSSGKMIDGQHRMHAIIKTGRSVPCLVVTGIEESMYTKLDKGRTRGFSDCIPGVANSKAVASIVHLLYSEQNATAESMIHPGGGKRGSNDDYKRVLAEHPGVIESASFMSGKKLARKLLGSGGGGYSLYRMSMVNQELAYDVISKLNSGVGLASRSPILSIREKLILSDHGMGINSAQRVMYIACAWRMVLEGKSGTVTYERAKEMWNWWGGKL